MKTTESDIIKAIQRAVGADEDGIWGAESELAFRRHLDSGKWAFEVRTDGDDLVCDGCWGTCFGGGNDPMDGGDTSSGVSTKGNPRLEACSLPMRYLGPHAPTRKALAGTPLPRFPWHTLVEVSDGTITIVVPVIDLGPARWTGKGIDLTIAAARRFDSGASATDFRRALRYRVLGGAAFI